MQTLILFLLALAVAALASALWGSGSRSTNNPLRFLGLALLFFVGQVITWYPQGYAWMVLSWELSAIGGILFFAIIPTATLTLAIAASASERWSKRSKVAIRILSLLTVVIPVVVPFGDEAGFVLFTLPFGIIHVCASLGFAATLGPRKTTSQATIPTPPALPNS